jgi:hypothetical protein
LSRAFLYLVCIWFAAGFYQMAQVLFPQKWVSRKTRQAIYFQENLKKSSVLVSFPLLTSPLLRIVLKG